MFVTPAESTGTSMTQPLAWQKRMSDGRKLGFGNLSVLLIYSFPGSQVLLQRMKPARICIVFDITPHLDNKGLSQKSIKGPWWQCHFLGVVCTSEILPPEIAGCNKRLVKNQMFQQRWGQMERTCRRLPPNWLVTKWCHWLGNPKINFLNPAVDWCVDSHW